MQRLILTLLFTLVTTASLLLAEAQPPQAPTFCTTDTCPCTRLHPDICSLDEPMPDCCKIYEEKGTHCECCKKAK